MLEAMGFQVPLTVLSHKHQHIQLLEQMFSCAIIPVTSLLIRIHTFICSYRHSTILSVRADKSVCVSTL